VTETKTADTDTASQSAISAVARIVLSLPPALRAAVVVVAVVVAGTVLYMRWTPAKDDALRGAGLYTNGVPDPNHPGADSKNPQNIEANDKALEDQTAATWHLTHEDEDRPEEVAIDPEHHVYYRYYSKSDHCVFIRRKDGDRLSTQWVRDPNFHQHDTHGPHTAPHAALLSDEAPGFLARAFDVVSLTVSAQGHCLNPHPGQFRYWWGSPLDSCNSPMYRQFADGCTHYQVYNRCANAWDSRITWTSCVTQHHQ
jgi:hypothetical protein